jgi:hypothetical protein
MKACAILSVENRLWILECSSGGINNDVVNDGRIAFSIDGEETERTLAKAQSKAFEEVRRVLDSAEIVEHGFPNGRVGFGLNMKGEAEIVAPINWRSGEGWVQFKLVCRSRKVGEKENVPLARFLLGRGKGLRRGRAILCQRIVLERKSFHIDQIGRSSWDDRRSGSSVIDSGGIRFFRRIRGSRDRGSDFIDENHGRCLIDL